MIVISVIVGGVLASIALYIISLFDPLLELRRSHYQLAAIGFVIGLGMGYFYVDSNTSTSIAKLGVMVPIGILVAFILGWAAPSRFRASIGLSKKK